jgi:peptidyl-prolyl cis-trans isomerase A (cyclophilin A)
VSQTSRRTVLAGAGALAATHAVAQAPAAPPPAAAPLPRVILQTALGAVTIELAADKAPISCANFLRYVDAGRFDGSAFYRAMKIQPDPLTGLIQSGAKDGRLFPPIAHESTTQTGLSNRDGAISMGRFAPGSATAAFFICVGDMSGLDAKPGQPGDNLGFAAFGHVVAGLDVAKAILVAPVSAAKAETEAMTGQMLDPKIAIVSAKRA